MKGHTYSHIKKNTIVVVLSAMAGETSKLQTYLDEFDTQNSIESDLVLTSGEQVTIGLLSAALKNHGIKSIPLLGWQIPIITDDNHEKAKILKIDNERVNEYFIENDVIVLAGFQGINLWVSEGLHPCNIKNPIQGWLKPSLLLYIL